MDNQNNPVWQSVQVSMGGTNVTGNLLVAKSPQAFLYDNDGNLVSNGLWTNTWDAENRLIESESLPAVPVGGKMKEEWTYLPDGRWYQRIVSTNNGTSYVPQYTNHFVWDGKVLLAVLDQTNGLVISFMRGLDLSGTMQGAGGVGGLLAVSFKTNGTHFAAFDGNGNVAALVNAADGTCSANYEYDPFGQAIRITGAVGKLNPIRFSTQFADDVKGTIKYLHRDYTPSTGTCPNRDPLGDEAFLQAQLKGKTWQVQHDLRGQSELPSYLFARNYPVGVIDCFGLKTLSVGKCEVIVFYGHGTQGQPHQFDFEGPCTAGIFLGCYDAETDSRISPPIRGIPGIPTTYGDRDWAGFNGVFDSAWNAAITKARGMCSYCKCMCHSITVRAVSTASWFEDWWDVPAEHARHPDQTVPCSSMNENF